MTSANKVTITRIFLIPVFVLFAAYYGQSVTAGEPKEWLRAAAIAVFLIASASDGIDGYLARRFSQKSRLGEILDPIADKGLLLTAVLTLTFSNWTYQFPLWFPIVVIVRDVVILLGSAIVHLVNGSLKVRPSLLGKTATFTQMTAIGWTMLQLPHHGYSVVVAGVITALSGIGYVADGIRQLKEGGHANAQN